jgi:hypothetical protein
MDSVDTVDNVKAWLENFPTEAVEHELTTLEAEAARITREIRKRRQLLDARATYLGISEDPDGQVSMDVSERRAARQRAIRNRNRRMLEAEVEEGDSAWQGVVEDPPALVRPAPSAQRIAASRPVQRAKKASSQTENLGGDANRDGLPTGGDSARPESRAEKLLWFLNRYKGETWKLSDIRDRLVEAGLLEDAPGETHGLQVTASRLFRTGRIERPMPAHYRLAADNKESGS